jgi:voltage-gated potassium channel
MKRIVLSRQRIFELIERAKSHDTASVIIDNFIILLICLNAGAIIAESFNAIALKYAFMLRCFEFFSVIIFTIEYLLRLWTADFKFPESKAPHIRYIFSFLAIFDLLAILPFYLIFVLKVNLSFTGILRLFRLVRILKITRYNDSLIIIAKVFKGEKDKILMTVFVICLMILIASSLMFHIENFAQPDKFSSIPATMWWAVGTFTGNTDVFPVTIAGKILSGIIGVLGIGLVALPSGIICSGFMKEIEPEKKEKIICPHCGKTIKRIKTETRK